MRDERLDPDLVRQQAEEEAASRVLSRNTPPSRMRIEPVLPMTAPGEPNPGVQTTRVARAAAVHRPGWGAALRIAASCTLGTVVGFIGGIMLGVKLQLVSWQSASIGAAAGLFLGWLLASGLLMSRGDLGRIRAYRSAILPAFAIFLVLAAAMFLVPFLTTSAIGQSLGVDIGVFWKTLGGGAVIAVLLGAALMRRALR